MRTALRQQRIFGLLHRILCCACVQVVKAFICVTERYKGKEGSELEKYIQEHVKRTTAAYKYPRKVNSEETNKFVSFLLCSSSGGSVEYFEEPEFVIVGNVL